MNAYSRSLSAFSASTARRGRGSASVTTLKQGKAQVLPDCFLFVAGVIIFQYSKAIEEADRRIISSRWTGGWVFTEWYFARLQQVRTSVEEV